MFDTSESDSKLYLNIMSERILLLRGVPMILFPRAIVALQHLQYKFLEEIRCNDAKTGGQPMLREFSTGRAI